MTKVLLLLSILTLSTATAHGQIRRGTGLLNHNHGPVLFYSYTSRVVIKPTHRDAFLRASRDMEGMARKETDCRSFYCYEDASVPNSFLVTGSWTTSPALQAHLAQPYMVMYFEQLAHWLAEPSSLTFHEIINQRVTTLATKP